MWPSNVLKSIAVSRGGTLIGLLQASGAGEEEGLGLAWHRSCFSGMQRLTHQQSPVVLKPWMCSLVAEWGLGLGISEQKC